MTLDDSTQAIPEGGFDSESSVRRTFERLSEAFSDDGDRSIPSSFRAVLTGFQADGEAIRLGRFTLVELLGEGTFASVYRARDDLLERDVALKIPKPEVLLSEPRLNRFLNEARILSRLHHPHIVPVLDAKADNFEFFIAREYCEGPNLAEWLAGREEPMDPCTAAEVVTRLAKAAQHANDQGVLHRDIKPSNVLLQPREDGHGGFPYTVLLSDFGLAKVFDRQDGNGTATGTMVGTPCYMAPEQARGNAEVDSSAEVYSLGVTLYELLTKTVPLRSDDHVEFMTMISQSVPDSVRKRNPEVPRDLEAITMKCLEKTPAKRYATPSDLALDLERFLRHEAVTARRSGPGRTLWRWMCRHPTLASLAATLLIAASIVYATLLNRDARVSAANATLKESLVRAETSRRYAEQLAYASDMRLAGRALADGDVRQLRRLVDRHRPDPHSGETPGFEWQVLKRAAELECRQINDSFAPVNCVRFSSDGRWLATCGEDGFLRLYDAKTLENHSTRFVGFGAVTSLAFSPDSRTIATSNADGSVVIRVCDSGEQLRLIEAHEGQANSILYSPDSASLLTAGADGVIRSWDFETGACLGELVGHLKSVDEIAIAGDGRLLASVSRDRTLRLWEVGEREAMEQLQVIESPYRFTSVGLSPDARWLSVGTLHEGTLVFPPTDRSATSVSPHLDPVESVAFDPTGRWAADGDRAGVIRFWPINGSATPPWAGHPITPISWCGHDDRIRSISFSSDGEFLATASKDGVVKVWAINDVIESNVAPLGRGFRIEKISHLDVATFVTADASVPAILRKWDYATNSELMHVTAAERVFSMGATRDGGSLFLGYLSGKIDQLDAKRLTTQRRIESIDSPILGLVVSGGDELLCAWTDRGLHWFDLPSLKRVEGLPDRRCNAVAMSDDGRWFALGAKPEDTIEIWDLRQRVLARVLPSSGGSVNALCFAPDHKTLAAADDLRGIKLWNVVTGKRVMTLEGETGRLNDLAFFPDQKRLVSVAVNRAIRIWHLPTARQLLELRPPTTHATVPGNAVLVSPDGRKVIVCLTSLRAHVYGAGTGKIKSP